MKDAADIDILVNNAGDIPGGSIDKIDEATWRHAWELKVFGYINLTRAIYAQMKARGHGVIVNDIGAAGEKFDANYICGSAGNAALMAFTRALGGKSLADNIRVVGINPGPVGTDRHVTLLKTRAKNQFGDENRYKEFQKGMPLGRPAHAREIGDLMAFLASDRSGYTSGVIFTVDGGHHVGVGVAQCHRHCEERCDEAIQLCREARDCRCAVASPEVVLRDRPGMTRHVNSPSSRTTAGSAS